MDIKYTPIPYRTGNFADHVEEMTSELVLPRLTLLEKGIWEKASPYQNFRDDKGHAMVVTYGILEAIRNLPFKDDEGNEIPFSRNVAVISGILHDIGWSQMTQEELALFNIPEYIFYDPILRNRHQEFGVKSARTLLAQVDLRQHAKEHILENISQHDTRKGFISPEDEALRLGDKLWQCSLGCLEYCMKYNRFSSPEEYLTAARKLKEKFENPVYREILDLEADNLETYLETPANLQRVLVLRQS